MDDDQSLADWEGCPEPAADRLCSCGCWETEHDPSGICHFCGPDDCSGFTYDEEATLIAQVLGADPYDDAGR
jgi:hypothetical protein